MEDFEEEPEVAGLQASPGTSPVPLPMESRLAACTFWMTFAEEQFEKIYWSDEKWLVLQQVPKTKNTMTCTLENPNQVVACKKAHSAKVMAWVGIVDRQVPVHWFERSVDGTTYLAML